MVIIETPVFTKRIRTVLSDEEYSKLQWALIINPQAEQLFQELRA